MENEEEHLEIYGDSGMSSKDAPIPRFLFWTYILLPIWGFISLYYFWNGTIGLLDPGSWTQLQKAALTTFPQETIEGLK